MPEINQLDIRLISAHNIESAWLASTAVIMKGEVCYTVEPTAGEGDKFKIAGVKIGDGIHKWSELPYQTFDSADHLYKLVTSVSTSADATTFSTTTYLQSNDGVGGTAYSNSSSAVLTIPGVSTTVGAGLMSTADKAKLDSYGNLTTAISTPTSTSTNIPSDYAVKKYTDDAIADLGKPMHYKGTVTTAIGLPSTADVGDTYKVAEKGNYGTPATAAKIGDMFILNESSAWDYIPSADDDVVISVGSANKWITTSGSASAVLIGHETTGIATTGVIGNATNVPIFTIDEAGHVTSATTAAIPSATTTVEGLTKKPSGDGTWINVDNDNKISHIGPGTATATYGGSASIPIISVDAKGHITSVSTVANQDYYTTGVTTASNSINYSVQFNRVDGNNKYGFTIPEATELLAGVSSTVSTDRLRNGSKVLVLNGNFPLT